MSGLPATRLGDVCTGHGCYPARPSCSGSPDTFTNSIAQMRVTDCYECHGCAVCPCHGGVLSAGSGTVNINNLQAGRQGDPVDCGSSADAHSPDVFIGG
ncbi:MAG: PAAR domain-containing protein [Proteobacteria bacterium]|nr:PAAR domain-containing protein [Pseudomonadota bacterium]